MINIIQSQDACVCVCVVRNLAHRVSFRSCLRCFYADLVIHDRGEAEGHGVGRGSKSQSASCGISDPARVIPSPSGRVYQGH